MHMGTVWLTAGQNLDDSKAINVDVSVSDSNQSQPFIMHFGSISQGLQPYGRVTPAIYRFEMEPPRWHCNHRVKNGMPERSQCCARLNLRINLQPVHTITIG